MNGYNGQVIKEAVESRGTVKEVSQDLKSRGVCSRATLYSIFKSDENVKVSTLKRLLEALGLTWADVFV